jgi:hypothetical protein
MKFSFPISGVLTFINCWKVKSATMVQVCTYLHMYIEAPFKTSLLSQF